MDKLYDVTVVLKDPEEHPPHLIAPVLKDMGVLFVTHTDDALRGLAQERAVDRLKKSRNVHVIARPLNIVEAESSRTIDAAAWKKEQEEKSAAAEDVTKKKAPKKKAPKKKTEKKKKKNPPKKKKSKKKTKNKRKAARQSKKRNRKKR